MSLVLQECDHEPMYWRNLNFDLMMALDEKSSDQQKYEYSSSGNHKCLCKILCQSIYVEISEWKSEHLLVSLTEMLVSLIECHRNECNCNSSNSC